jgi:NADH dehydrogenase FAD-containing subunit
LYFAEVWYDSTGLALNPLVQALEGVEKTKKALLTDGKLHLLDDSGKPLPNVWAIGDCATVKDVDPLPATAQVANQKAAYIIKTLNAIAKGRAGPEDKFEFKDRGSLAYIGNWKALYSKGEGENMSGAAAFVLWRSAYFATTLSIRNK